MLTYALVPGYVALFVWLIGKSGFFNTTGVPVRWLQGVFLLKVLAGSALGLLYTYYYTDRTTSDTFKFFDDSGILFATLTERPYDFFRMFTGIGGNDPDLRHYYESMYAWLNTDVLFNDNKTIIRLNTLFRFFSMGNYYVHVVFINVLSLVGLTGLFRSFSSTLPGRERLLFFTTFLLPSVLFWGSGLLKDGLLLFALGILVYVYRQVVAGDRRWSRLGLFILSFLLLLFTKFYVIVTITPGLIAWWLSRKQSPRGATIRFLAVYGVFFLLAFNLHRAFPAYKLADIIYYKQQNFYTLAAMTRANSVIQVPDFHATAWSLGLHAPLGFLTTLLRPTLWDAKGNLLILASAVENIGLLIWMVLLLRRPRTAVRTSTNFVSFSIAYVFLLYSLIGLITPILGAMVRYKVVGMPFLFFCVVAFSGLKKGEHSGALRTHQGA